MKSEHTELGLASASRHENAGDWNDGDWNDGARMMSVSEDRRRILGRPSSSYAKHTHLELGLGGIPKLLL
jgi:hypothetical protein